MFSAIMFLYSSEVAKSPGWIIVNAGFLRANINLLPNFFVGSLPEFPGKIMTPAMKL